MPTAGGNGCSETGGIAREAGPAKGHGYTAEVAVPIQSEDLVSVFWVGRTANAAAFGAAWDAWRDQLGDPKSVAARLWARLLKCPVHGSRRGYDLY